MRPDQKSTNRRDKLTVIIIAVVLVVAATGLVVGVGMQIWSYRHDPTKQLSE